MTAIGAIETAASANDGVGFAARFEVEQTRRD